MVSYNPNDIEHRYCGNCHSFHDGLRLPPPIPPLLPPDDPRAPKFWMNETGGVLQQAVKDYLDDKTLTLAQVALMRAYLKQWAYSPVWQGEALEAVRTRITEANSHQDIDGCIYDLVNMGMDPL